MRCAMASTILALLYHGRGPEVGRSRRWLGVERCGPYLAGRGRRHDGWESAGAVHVRIEADGEQLLNEVNLRMVRDRQSEWHSGYLKA